MPDLALGFAIAAAVNWVLLMVVIRIVPRIADLTLPETPTLAWQLAVISVAMLAAGLVPYVGWLAGWVVVYLLMKRWFDATFWSVFIVWAVSKAIQLAVAFLAIGALLSAG